VIEGPGSATNPKAATFWLARLVRIYLCLSAVKEAGATQVETTGEAEIHLVEASEAGAAGMVVAMTGVLEAGVAEADFA